MNRSAKRHRSTKVPNVKLRPAPPLKGATVSTRSREQDALAEDEAMRHYRALRTAHASGKQREEHGDGDDGSEDDEEDEGEGKDNDDQAPLVGCVVCTTGFDEEKVTLHECAIALGATVDGNLTQSATHLIAKEPGSDKYSWAVKLGIPILRPAWLYDLRARWQKAVPLRFDDLIEEHRLDTFQGLTMAMAGVTDVEKRRKIRADVKSASGETPVTFKLDSSFTHLLCEDVKGSETLHVVNKYLQKAVRYRRRGEEVPTNVADADMMRAALKLKLVWVEWVQDCLAAQCCIPERLYSINEPRMNEKQRQSHIDAIVSARAAKAISTAAAMHASKLAMKDPVKAAAAREAKSGRTASDGETKVLKHNMPRPTTKRPNMAIEQLMEHISHTKATEKQATPPVEVAEHSGCQAADKVQSAMHPAKPLVEKRIVEENAVASTSPDAEAMRKAKPATVSTAVDDDDALEINEAAGLGRSFNEKSLSQVLFRVDLFDDFKNDRVFAALRNDGIATVLKPDDPRSADFHILPLSVGGRDMRTESPHLGIPVTHFFIERCLTESRLLRLDESFVLQPSRHTFPLQGAEAVYVALTGIGSDEDGHDRHQIVMALEEAGIKTASIFKRGVHTHLLVGKSGEGSSSTAAKLERAKKWGVPVVGWEFVEQIYRDGTIAPSPVVAKTAVRLSCSSMAGDDSTYSQDHSTMLRETQATDLSAKAPAPLSSTDAKQSAPLKIGASASRAWLRRSPEARKDKSEGDANVDVNLSTSVVEEKPVDGRPMNETQELGTQVLTASSDQMTALLNQHRLAMSTSDVAGASSAMGGRKPRRLPPSMRERMRERSGTPLAEQTPERQIAADEPAMDSMQIAEELLARGREQEVLGWLQGNYSNATQQSMSGGGDDEVASMRIVYDDPIARREKRKIEAIVMQTIKDRREEEEAREQGGQVEEPATSSQPSAPHKHITPRSEDGSPLKRVRSMATGHSPKIKARRQPGTAGRDVV